MTTLFFTLITVFLFILSLKFYFGIKYWNKENNYKYKEFELKDKVSVIQPILSGDSNLKNTLLANVINIPYANFIWLVDEDDSEGIRVTSEIISENNGLKDRIKIIFIGKIPDNFNPKVYKLNFAMPYLKEFSIILDDDTIIKHNNLDMAFYRLKENNLLITGLPYFTNYNNNTNFLSRLVEGFVNSNSFATYLPIAYLKATNTINGMFYICRSETLKSLDAFNSIQEELCDDYAMAQLFKKNNLDIIQSTILCNVFNEIKDRSHYINLMKRWMVFANRYFKENFSFKFIILIIVPSGMPLLILSLSLIMSLHYKSFSYTLIFLSIHLLKGISTFFLRKQLYGCKESISAIFYELISDYLQLVHFIHALFSKNSIKWRDKEIKLDNNKIEHNKSKES